MTDPRTKGDGSQQSIDRVARGLSGLKISGSDVKEISDEKTLYDQDRFTRYRDLCVKAVLTNLTEDEHIQRQKFGVESGMHPFACTMFAMVIQHIKRVLPKTDLQIKKLNGLRLSPKTPGQGGTRFGIGFNMHDLPLPTTTQSQHKALQLYHDVSVSMANGIVRGCPEHDVGHVPVLWIDYIQTQIIHPVVHLSVTAERHCATCIGLKAWVGSGRWSSDNPVRSIKDCCEPNARDSETLDRNPSTLDKADADPMEIDEESSHDAERPTDVL